MRVHNIVRVRNTVRVRKYGRSAIGEVISASILLGAMGVAAVIILGGVSERAQVTTDDIRSRMDTMRAQAVEQLDVTGVSWGGGAGISGNYSFLVSNYGDYPAKIPFALYDSGGNPVTNADVVYARMDNTNVAHCTVTVNCQLYDTELESKGIIRVIVGNWSGTANGADPLIIITDTGRAMRVGN